MRNLLRFLPGDARAELFVLAPDSLELPVGRSNIRRIRAGLRLENPFLRAAWERIELPRLVRRLRADVLFCPGGIVGAAAPMTCRTVTMFRNMVPFDRRQTRRYPFGYARLRNWILRRALLRSMQEADLVIFVSEFAKHVIAHWANRALRNAVVIPHGVGAEFRATEGNHRPAPEWLPHEGYLLYVSTIDVYKAQVEVVLAYALLKQRRQTTEKLILVGAENRSYGRKVRAKIDQLGVKDDVVLAGPVPYDELPTLYRHARVNLFASESENCPNVLLEALGAARPVLCSNRPPMPEFAGDAAVYFDPSSPIDLADKLASVLDNPARIHELSAKASERSLLYDWNLTARRTWGAITNLCE
jgi:glycosyltransferase involved in cell wall biosynthesis